MNEERRFELMTQGIEAVLKFFQFLVVGTVFILISYFVKEVLIAYAGKSTQANLSFSLFTKFQADRWIAYIFGGGGITYGLAQRNLRRSNIKRMSKFNTILEEKIDPNRTSSGLTPTGKTQKSDL